MPSTSGPFDRGEFEALYFDGIRARRHQVLVRLQDDGISVVAENGDTLDHWPYDLLELSDQGRGSVRVIKRGTEARLTIEHPRAFAALQGRAPELVSQERRAIRNVFVAIGITMAVIVGGYLALPVLSTAVVALIPLETEVRIGDAVASDIADLFAPQGLESACDTMSGRRALNTLVDRLAPYRSGPFAYRVEVLDSEQTNALALPGGRILLLRGVLDKAENPGEIAAILAHEMVHVDKRHGMKSMVRHYGISMLTDMMFGGGVMGSVSGFAITTTYSREAEQEADLGAIDTLTRSGIGTEGMATFFTRLKDSEESNAFTVPEFLSTHPDTAAREALAKSATGVARGDVLLAPQDWQALKAICGERQAE